GLNVRRNFDHIFQLLAGSGLYVARWKFSVELTDVSKTAIHIYKKFPDRIVISSSTETDVKKGLAPFPPSKHWVFPGRCLFIARIVELNRMYVREMLFEHCGKRRLRGRLDRSSYLLGGSS